MLDLNSVSTSDLVEALRHRKGVEHQWVDPHNVKSISVNGPARVLVVID